MRADMEVALAMLMLPAIEVCEAEEGNTCSAVPQILITCPISSVTVHRGTRAKSDQTGGAQDEQTHKQS